VITLARTLPEALLADARTEILPFERGGSGMAATWSADPEED
jgi:hypothetical protein